MAELPPNPDRMLIPQHDPRLILSAETSFSMPDLARSVDIYAEDFHLDRDLVLKNKSDEPKSKARLGLFVKSLSTAVPKGNEVLKIDIGGADGTKDTANASSGGQAFCFIQRLDQRYVDTFNIDAYGGHGYNQVLDSAGGTPASPAAGGNGGTGGQVSVAFGSFKYKPLLGVSEVLRTVEESTPKLDKKDFSKALIELVRVFTSIEVHMESRVTQSIGVRGGIWGVGLGKQSENGKPGADGDAAVALVSNPEELWELSMCFAHPTQCNMVLERAKARYYAVSRVAIPPGLTVSPRRSRSSSRSGTRPWDSTPKMDSGLDAYNDSYNSVPLGSFGSYEKNLESSLTYLGKTELRLIIPSPGPKPTSPKPQTRSSKSWKRPSLSLFDELINAGTQLLFVAKWPMAVLQGANLIHQMATKIIKEDGTTVERQYLVRRVSNITGSIRSLNEGYKMLSNGKLQDEDPDAAKLLIQEKELFELIEDVNNSLSEKTVERVKTLFRFYITLVVQRSQDIMRYNALVSTLVRYRTESQSLQQQLDQLRRANIATIDVHHPAIVVFMQKLYLNAIRMTEYWLYKAQRAYNYAALNDDNIIGDVLGDDPPFSRFDSTLLSAAHQNLSDAYQKYYLDKLGPARGTFTNRTVALDPDEHIEVIRDSGRNSCTFFVKVVPGKAFDGMANVRLLSVRCFLDGARVASTNKLHLTLTHAGMETLVDEVKKRHEFKHKAQILTAFKYHLETGEVELASTIGEGREESGYALVGPFVTWRVDVNKEYNTGLDLSGVTGGRLEFDGHYQPIR
ncbi:predicted protein [Chaetomium globosum CBS 148.51]|uniref:Uncharacterized protein n=1 Tax=Chaetomium globosum (strain ATCC 6205 / CBS 148.51 / DSM 1962 / NBRC 6347 / NRRL 1970) TaxID=306901 RepID=Q2GVX1_CHAGB|nr:uncharacterized protein CHGG_07883 [Chaetomium globosum CBS 148.51]EAQ86630.1 predicted protein [Chaetomium globosum CBS 148.51]